MSIHATVCKRFKFSAAHHIEGYDGPCARNHGHTFHAEVYAAGLTDELGMVVDFSAIKAAWEEHIHPVVDHADLNEASGNFVPSTENVAAWMLQRLRQFIPQVYKVRLWEGPDQFAEVEEPRAPLGGFLTGATVVRPGEPVSAT